VSKPTCGGRQLVLIAVYATENDERNGEDYLDATDDIGVELDVFMVNY